MADVLDQSEVDALLAAVGGSTNQVEEILGSDGSKVHREVTSYDFKRPERVSKDQIRALEGMHEGFARNFGAAMSGFLRTILEVRIVDTEQLTYSEFTHSLPNPTCFNLISLKALEASICLEISPLIIYPIIDRLLGGTHVDAFIPQRALTSIEQRLVGRIIDRAIKMLGDTWSSLGIDEFELTETESNPHLVQVVAPNEVVIVITFELKLGGKTGTMSLCIPFATIEPILDKLASQNWLSYRRKDNMTNVRETVAGSLKHASVNLRAFLARTRISMRELMELEVGDVIQTEKPANSEVIIQIEGKNKFAGRLGQFRDNRAIRVTRLAAPDERL
ncbi:MAG: flagellar motor switch protein FliM [Phycisphaerae bacterium]|nr:flagellar motor switch protein FliM [Phycisphaerae bacterium]